MIAQHYDEEKIIAFLGNASAAVSDPHMTGCRRCSQALTEYRTLVADLGDDEVWADAGTGSDVLSASTIGVLRGASQQMEREDVEANGFLVSLLALPRESWKSRLRQSGAGTAGMVRALIAASDRAIDSMPPDAVELGSLAVEVAEELEPSSYPSDEVMRLRGVSWRQYAYSLFFVGRFVEAAAGIQKSRQALDRCAVNEYDLARLNIVASMSARGFERLDEAISLAKESRIVLAASGDREKTASAAMTESASLYKAGRSRDSLAVLLPIASDLDQLSSDTQGRLLANIGLAYRELNDLEKSVRYYTMATEALAESNVAGPEILRIEWNVAAMLLLGGKRREAQARLVDIVSRFKGYGMASEAVLASLDLAEILLGDEKYQDVEDICRSALSYYENVGVSYGRAAQTALAYLQESARSHRVTPTVVQHVRTYLRRLPQQPNLLFAAPPD
jgi:tetratricopeptide (TPR) repeat protein